MSCQPCGCDPEAGWVCLQHSKPIEPPLIYPESASSPAAKRKVDLVRSLMNRAVEAMHASAAEEAYFTKGTPMTLQQFQSSIARTYRPNLAACYGLGIAGEAGEVADIVKKALYHDEAINALSSLETLLLSPRRDDMRLELGDVLWYVAAIASDWGFTLDEIAQGNIDKLAARYPEGFVKGGGVRGPEGSAMNESQVAALMLSDLKEVIAPAQQSAATGVLLRAGKEPFLLGPAYEVSPLLDPLTLKGSVMFACGCCEVSDRKGLLSRTYCNNGECRRLAGR